MTDPTPDRWALAEVMGHQAHAGKISEETIAGTPMLRIDQPRGDEFVTVYVSGASLFRLTPCSEEIARAHWANRTSAPAALTAGRHFDIDDDPDDEPYECTCTAHAVAETCPVHPF